MPTPSVQIDVALHYRTHHGWVQAWLRRRLGNAHDAADLAHDVFLRLLQRPCRFDDEHHARAWLRRVSGNLCIDLWRRRALEQAWLEALASRPDGLEVSELQRAMVLETLQQIQRMLACLPERVARCFILVQVEGSSYREAAATLGVTERSVTRYMAQAMYQCLLLEVEFEQASE